jgi:hypothetical protein
VRGEPTPTEQAALERNWEEAVGRRFRTPDGTAAARLVLEQVADTSFALHRGFQYLADDGRTIDVAPSDLRDGRTDLTSVPQALTWFVGRYGRHTPAALLHDALLHRAERDATAADTSPLPGYEEADGLFREALASLEVPPLRRTTMWAAVTFGTRLRAGGWPTVAIVAWLVASAAGTAALAVAVAVSAWVVVAVALAAPLAGALLWGRQWVAGVVAGYMAVFVALPTLVGAVSMLVSAAVDTVLLRLAGAPTDVHVPGPGGV